VFEIAEVALDRSLIHRDEGLAFLAILALVLCRLIDLGLVLASR
jgi:hypothetical protein